MRKPWEKDKHRENFNEYYTLYSECEKIFRPIISKLMDKHIHCPADSEESNIVKWLKDNTNSKVTYSGLPDVDMNSNRAHELMLEADMIITNPPFSSKHFTPFFIWLNDVYVDEYHKDYFIWGPIFQGGSEDTCSRIKYIYAVITSRHLRRDYYLPDGSITSAVTIWYCSWKVPLPKLKYKEPKTQIKYHNGIPVFNKSENVPPTYGGWMYVPCTYLNYIYLEDYEIDYKDSKVPGKFVRWKIRRKRKNHDK